MSIKKVTQGQTPCFDYLVDPSFQENNRLFVLLFENSDQSIIYKKQFVPTVEIKDCNVMIYTKNVFDHSIRNDMKLYDHIRETAIGQGGDCTTGCFIS